MTPLWKRRRKKLVKLLAHLLQNGKAGDHFKRETNLEVYRVPLTLWPLDQQTPEHLLNLFQTVHEFGTSALTTRSGFSSLTLRG